MSAYPPVPQRRPGSGKKWAIGCCGGCLLLTVVAVVVIALALPRIKGVVAPIVDATKQSIVIAEKMERLSGALERYEREKGKYPDKLSQLVPNYVESADGLRHPDGPSGKQFTYHKPGPNTPGSAVVVEFTELVIEVPGAPPQHMPVRLLRNGELEMSSGGRTRRLGK